MIKIVCISDTHGHEPVLPDGDILICSGDFTFRGRIEEVKRFNTYLQNIKPKFKDIVVIAGNHELTFDPAKPEYNAEIKKVLTEVHYLENSSVEVQGLKIFGSPNTPEFCNWAFQLRGNQAEELWKTIPNDTDIIVTHGPAAGLGDRCPDGSRVGCVKLLSRILEIKPQLHVSGHIHGGYGVRQFDGVTFVNASICNEYYENMNDPVIIEL